MHSSRRSCSGNVVNSGMGTGSSLINITFSTGNFVHYSPPTAPMFLGLLFFIIFFFFTSVCVFWCVWRLLC